MDTLLVVEWIKFNSVYTLTRRYGIYDFSRYPGWGPEPNL